MFVVLLFILTFSGGVLGSWPTKNYEELCPKNEHYTRNDPTCPRTCGNRQLPKEAQFSCDPYTGCVCDNGYVRLFNDGTGPCVRPSKCASSRCTNDRNAVYKECPNPCPPTCDQPNPRPCAKMCKRYGCECVPGYILSKIGGKCIRPEQCPGLVCPTNERYVVDDVSCVKTCANRLLSWKLMGACKPYTGCVCNIGYVRENDDASGPCIPEKQCRYGGCNGDPNASPSDYTSSCPATCAQPYSDGLVCDYPYDPNGCECNPGYVLSYYGGRCIPLEDCPGYGGCNGDPNASPSDYTTSCPATCAQPYTDSLVCDYPYDPNGCECNPGYVLSYYGGRCIPLEDCPEYGGCNGDPNASPSDYTSSCPATCAQPYTDGLICDYLYDPNGCDCNPGYVLSYYGGRCIPLEDCPGYGGCNGDPNASPSDYTSSCPVTCAQPYTDSLVCDYPYDPNGCECNPGYVLSYYGGRCIPLEDCPEYGECNGDPNASPSDYTSSCPATCAQPYTDGLICDYLYDPNGCDCNPGYVLSYYGGRCIPLEDCPDIGCNGDPNAMADGCPSYCPPTCTRPNTDGMPCIATCDPSGCVCKPGYILTKKGGRCIRPDQCPANPGCNGDPNASPNDFPSSCPPTCRQPDTTSMACIDMYDPSACVCNPGYILTKQGGICVEPNQCPGGAPSCPRNKTYVSCYVDCPTNYCPQDDNTDMIDCVPPYPCSPGCACQSGYLMLSYDDPRCVLASECPPVECTRPNEVWEPFPPACYRERCDDINTECYGSYPASPRCVCAPGYKRNQVDICVPESELYNEPPANCTRPNELWDPTPSNCYLERCEDMDAVCDNSYPSPPRCVCKPGCYRDKDDICIPAWQCPKPLKCGLNEIEVECRTICPPQNCEIAYTDYGCDDYKNICERGCDCLPNHLRNGSGICILNDNCPYPSSPICGVNEIARDCRRICPPQTCQSRYALYKCREDIPCEPGCDCVPNYLRNSEGVCIPVDKRDLHNVSCNSDPNAIPKQYPLPCPSTCTAPNPFPCKKMSEPIGCECKSGYMIDEEYGKCVLPDNCPGGNPCGKNEEFRDCASSCPSSLDYCPIDDTRRVFACDESFRCLPGCACKLNHKRLSYEDSRCIVASDCPPVNCTRPNEVWDGCPSECFSGYCEDREYQDVPCNTFVLNCQPKCVCKRDTFRNASDICVPASECPPLPTVCTVPDNCIRTCASPNPPDCPYEPPNDNIDGCECKRGYILSEVGGKCIKIEDCPKHIACHGDPHAQPKQCPAPCPSTCYSPDAIPCYKMCDPIGCECKDGYLLSNSTGQCILPEQCQGGDPCGPNGYFVPCRSDCPTNFCPVDDSRDPVVCIADPNSCLSGCNCNLNHKKLSHQNRRCIVSSDCPPVDCTRPNEVWDACPSDCFSGYCEDQEYQDTICYTLVLNCQPKCVCKRDTFRNASDICVPACECR